MPKMKWGDDFDELPEEWEESDFQPYDGDEPPGNIVLKGAIERVWATTFKSGSQGFKSVFKASGNTGDRAKYNGWSCWDNIIMLPQNAWRYGPWLQVLDVTLRDVKLKTILAADDDNVGTPVVRIGTTKFAKPVSCSIRTKREQSEGYDPKIVPSAYFVPKSQTDEDDDADELDDEDVPF